MIEGDEVLSVLRVVARRTPAHRMLLLRDDEQELTIDEAERWVRLLVDSYRLRPSVFIPTSIPEAKP